MNFTPAALAALITFGAGRALADFAGGDQQQFIHALQRGGERRFVV
jgi:hypothetical protein